MTKVKEKAMEENKKRKDLVSLYRLYNVRAENTQKKEFGERRREKV